jgi:hypothetical protein
MTLPPWLAKALDFSLVLSYWQTLGLAFLLGTFSVATLSDLKRLTAQREFVEIWLVFVFGVLAYDVHEGRFLEGTEWELVAVKWALIGILSGLSLDRIGVLFRLARADVAALAAAASLLSPVLVVVFFVEAKVLALIIGPLLRRGRTQWPFMPVVTLATLGTLALPWFCR